MYHRINELRKKGWTEQEIYKTLQIYERAKKHKEENKTLFELIIFWVVLVVGIIGNVIVSLTFIPFLLVLNGFYLYLVLAILALAFGFLFEILIRDIENLESHHHRSIQIIVPVFAVINFFVIVYVSNKIDYELQIANQHNPYLIGIVYAIAFLLPYFYYHTKHGTIK